MAVVTFDHKNNKVTVLVEAEDSVLVLEKDNGTTHVYKGDMWYPSHVFVNGEIALCMIRGERS